MSQLSAIESILSQSETGKVMLADPVQVSLPHNMTFNVYGAWLGPDGVYLMDGTGDWHGPILETQLNAPAIIACLHHRLESLIMSHA